MIIGVDMDGVVCDLHEPWLAAYNRTYGDALTKAACVEYDLARLVLPACGRKIYAFLNDEDLYATAPPIAGALAGVRALRAASHRVVFVTSTGRALAAPKRRWLERHDFLVDGHGHDGPHDDLVNMSDKGLLHADALIEDNPKQLHRFKGTLRILLDQPWNGKVTDFSRANNWDAVVQLVTIETTRRYMTIRDDQPQPQETALEEAQRLVHGPRNVDYGDPAVNDARIAALWRAAFGWDVRTEDVWQAMVLTKIARERIRPKRDNRVDVAGYAEVGDWIHRSREAGR